MNPKMIYAPVIITTCNRYKHLVKCIESLEKNNWAKHTELYISVDYPPYEKYVEGWKQICEFLKEPPMGFKKTHIFIQEENLGPCKNIDFLYDLVFQTHDRVIVTEDDNFFSPNFLEYIDKGLIYYENDPRIMAVGGYSPNLRFYTHGNNVVALTDFCMWGCGLWREKRELLLERMNYSFFEDKAKNPLLMWKLYRNRSRYFSRLLGLLLADTHAESLRGDVNMGITLGLNNWYTIHPVVSKVRNLGFDGSGQNITGSADSQREYESQPIDTAHHFSYQVKKLKMESRNNRMLDKNNEWNSERAKWYHDPLTYLIYWILGKKNFHRLIRGRR